MKFVKGCIPWNKGKKRPEFSGENHPMFGKKHTKEALKKMHKFNKGDKNYFWKGGKIKKNGYNCIYMPEHPFKSTDCYILNSRLTMEKHLGRYLTRKEVVHHINGIKDDDRIENLMLFENNSAHIKFHNQ